MLGTSTYYRFPLSTHDQLRIDASPVAMAPAATCLQYDPYDNQAAPLSLPLAIDPTPCFSPLMELWRYVRSCVKIKHSCGISPVDPQPRSWGVFAFLCLSVCRICLSICLSVSILTSCLSHFMTEFKATSPTRVTWMGIWGR